MWKSAVWCHYLNSCKVANILTHYLFCKQHITVGLKRTAISTLPSGPDHVPCAMCLYSTEVQFSSIQLLSCIQFFATPWNAAHQASLSITTPWTCSNSWSIESVIPSSHLILCHPLLLLLTIFPSIRVFSNESVLHIRWPKYWSFSASASVLPMNIQDWFPLGLTGLISLQSKGLSRVFSNTTVQKHQFFGAQPSSQSNSHIHTWPQEKP